MKSAAERVDSYIQSIQFGEGIDFDKYLDVEEKAKVKEASYWRQKVLDRKFNPSASDGFALPWLKAIDFRIRRGESTIHTGQGGHRKSMMLGLFQLALIAQGQKCLSVSLEMQANVTMERMISQYAGLDDPSIQTYDRFFKYVKDKLFLYDQVGTVKAQRVIAVSRYAIEELGVTQVFLDSLMKFGVKKKDLDGQAEFVDQMTTLGKDTGAHMHLVAHANKADNGNSGRVPTIDDVAGSADITNMVDNVIIHYQNKKESRTYDQLMIVAKQRNPEGKEAEPSFLFTFDDSCLQFKSYSHDPRMNYEDWEMARWR